jgi:hypothetical protein
MSARVLREPTSRRPKRTRGTSSMPLTTSQVPQTLTAAYLHVSSGSGHHLSVSKSPISCCQYVSMCPVVTTRSPCEPHMRRQPQEHKHQCRPAVTTCSPCEPHMRRQLREHKHQCRPYESQRPFPAICLHVFYRQPQRRIHGIMPLACHSSSSNRSNQSRLCGSPRQCRQHVSTCLLYPKMRHHRPAGAQQHNHDHYNQQRRSTTPRQQHTYVSIYLGIYLGICISNNNYNV